jgi:hypothetical protein
VLRGGDASRECYFWFEEFFHFSGDHIPNSNEIHIENCSLISLFKLYRGECFNALKFTQWKEIWDELFPHVKMRTYKQVEISIYFQ